MSDTSTPGICKVVLRLLPHLGLNLELYYARFVDADRTHIMIEPS